MSDYNNIQGRKNLAEKIDILNGQSKDAIIKVRADVTEAQKTIKGFRGTLENEKNQIDIQWRGNTFATLDFKPIIEQIRTAKQYISEFMQKFKTNEPQKLSQKLNSVKNKAREINSSFNKIPNITNKINNNIKRHGHKHKNRVKERSKICGGISWDKKYIYATSKKC